MADEAARVQLADVTEAAFSGVLRALEARKLAGSVVFGVVGGTVDQPRVAYLAEPLPVTPDLLELAEPVEPAEVFRFGAPCAESGCRHFDGTRCRLVEARCRWWREAGPDACRRCPLVVTSSWNPGPELGHAPQRDLGPDQRAP